MFVGLVTVALAAVIVESRGVLPSTATVTNGAINSKISNEETILTAEDFENAKKLTLGQKYRKHDRKGMENPDLFEGDIANPELNSSTIYLFMGQANSTDPNGTMRNAIRNRNRRWPENVIPYTISTSYSTNE
uniref:Peptidase M12A domain-containing protein n=1 Tax=Plectus sambesii TaxID=2011161 RepID=A0A914UZN9_9BILA